MKILVLSSHTQSLFWFRLDMMKAFQNVGADVVAVGSEPEEVWSEAFQKYDIVYRKIPVSRNGLSIRRDIKTFKAIKRLIKEIRPDKIFTYQAKTIVYGSLASKCIKETEVYPLVAGLGSIFRGQGLKNKIIKSILKIQYKLAFNISKTVIFQNMDDRDELVGLGLLPKEKTAIVNGSGVNTSELTPNDLPEKKAILFIGRLIADKGVREYLSLCKRLKEKRNDIRCMLVGPFDTNPSAISKVELYEYIKHDIIEYFGEQRDIKPFMKQCTVYVLPSYHEGTPKTVLEAMSMGRPIVTTQAPGCRETVKDSLNGYLVPIKDVDALESAVEKILDSPDLAKQFGIQSRKIAVEKYDVRKVNESIMKIMSL